jgi:hypothetical protein
VRPPQPPKSTPGQLSIVKSRRNTEPTHPPGVDSQIPHTNPCQPKKALSHHSRKTSCTMAPARRTSRAAAKRAQQALGKSFSCTALRCNPWMDLLVLPLEQLQPAWPTTVLQTTLRNQLPQFSWCNRALVGSSQGLHHPGPSPAAHKQLKTGAFEGGAGTCESVPIYHFPSH